MDQIHAFYKQSEYQFIRNNYGMLIKPIIVLELLYNIIAHLFHHVWIKNPFGKYQRYIE